MHDSLHAPMSVASLDEAPPRSFFPWETPVSYDTCGEVASRFGDLAWDFTSMSTDGTTTKTLHFYAADVASTPAPELSRFIREQHKALMWLHIDAGRTRAWATLQNTNFALHAWCKKAADKEVDLYTFLTNAEWVAEGALALNTHYLTMTPAALQTLWRHRRQLGAPADLPLQRLRDALNEEVRRRPSTNQTPLIPSRLYCEILAALGDRTSVIEHELDDLIDAYADFQAASPGVSEGVGKLILGQLTEHQVALMLVVAAYTGMRIGEVSVLPIEGALIEFEHMGATHYEVRGPTHKLNNGVKRSTTWVTSDQGARAVQLGQRIARVIAKQHGKPSKAGQQTLLFPSTQDPFRSMSTSIRRRSLLRLREHVCPLIEQSDIDELDRLELARGWSRADILVGKRWPLAFHQLRRSLAVYAHRSGMVGLPALKAQLQHITQEMTSYYADGFSRAVNLVFDSNHFSHEWNAAKAESSYFAYALGVLFSDETLLGEGARRMADTVESRSRQDTLRLFQQNKLAYRETPLGGCTSTEVCTTHPLEPIPYDCLERNCANQVVFGSRLDGVITFQRGAVATLERNEAGSVEHRLEVRNLEVLLRARDRFRKGT